VSLLRMRAMLALRRCRDSLSTFDAFLNGSEALLLALAVHLASFVACP